MLTYSVDMEHMKNAIFYLNLSDLNTHNLTLVLLRNKWFYTQDNQMNASKNILQSRILHPLL